MNAKDLIIGQDSALAALERPLNGGRLAHCYVFAGPEGTGKRTAALALAKALQCQGERVTNGGGAASLEFCGMCASCRQIEARCHPDVLLWADRPRPAWWGSSRTPKLYAGPLAMEEVRQLKGEMSLAPALGSRRLFIIDRADQMDTEPANSLLKTLEEPPGERVVVLLAENCRRLLPTILSRAHVVRFSLVQEGVICSWLREIVPELEEGIVQRAVALAGGRPGWAHLFALNPGIVDAAERAVAALVKVACGDPFAPFSAPGIFQSAAREWQRVGGEVAAPQGLEEGNDGEETPREGSSPDWQMQRDYLPLLLNAMLSLVRQGTMRGMESDEPGKGFGSLRHLGPQFYGALVPIVVQFLNRLAANVSVPLLSQLFCLKVAATSPQCGI